MEQLESDEVRAYIIWEPILPTDRARPISGALSRVADARAAQYWDPHHLTAAELAQVMESDSEHPRPSCCWANGVLWDLIAVYPKDARWDASLPRAAYIGGPVWTLAPLPEIVAEQVGRAGPLQP